jgi:hypothetical protein
MSIRWRGVAAAMPPRPDPSSHGALAAPAGFKMGLSNCSEVEVSEFK